MQTKVVTIVNLSALALDEPIKDDGFGGDGVDFLADGFGDGLGDGLALPGIDDLPTAAADELPLEPVDVQMEEEPAKGTQLNETTGK